MVSSVYVSVWAERNVREHTRKTWIRSEGEGRWRATIQCSLTFSNLFGAQYTWFSSAPHRIAFVLQARNRKIGVCSQCRRIAGCNRIKVEVPRECSREDKLHRNMKQKHSWATHVCVQSMRSPLIHTLSIATGWWVFTCRLSRTRKTHALLCRFRLRARASSELMFVLSQIRIVFGHPPHRHRQTE